MKDKIPLAFKSYLHILPNNIRGGNMDRKTKAKYTTRAKIIKAMAHPTRLFIVDQLSHKQQCVCELTKMVGADTSTVSRHLSILYEAGIVDSEKRGQQVWYSLKVPCVLNFFKCVESVIQVKAREQLELSK